MSVLTTRHHGSRSITEEATQVFLMTYARTGSVTQAAQVSGVARSTWFEARKQSKELAAAWKEAHDIHKESLVDEAVRRAKDGWDEPVFYQGAQCGTVRKFSDNLLMFLIKQRDPSYRDHSTINLNASGAVGSVRLETDDPVAAVRAYQEMMKASTAGGS
ncbi:MAG: terminase [Steroidobacteraceae bacterium]